jgi:ankyrin repeat protein
MPLSWAAENGHKTAVQLLLNWSANIEAKTVVSRHGQTPLQCAVENGREEVIELLLDSGADVEAISNSNQKPPLQASVRGHGAVMQWLLYLTGSPPSTRRVILARFCCRMPLETRMRLPCGC